MKAKFLIAAISALTLLIGRSDAVSAPADVQLKAVVNQMAKAPNETFFWMITDIDGDGINDLLVTSKGNREEEDTLNYAWAVYKGNSDGTFTQLKTANGESTLSLWIGRCWVGVIPEIGRYGILHLVCGTGGHAKCQYKAVLVQDNKLTEVPIGQPVNAEENFYTMWGRLKGPNVPIVHKALASEIK